MAKKRKMKARPVLSMEWRGSNLHVVWADDASKTVYKQACIVGYTEKLKLPRGTTMKKVSLTVRRVRLYPANISKLFMQS